MKELDAVPKKFKAENLNEIPPEVWKTGKFDDILLPLVNAVNKQNIIEKWLHPPLPQER